MSGAIEQVTLHELLERGWLAAWINGECELSVGHGIFNRPILRIELCNERHENAERFADVYEWWPLVRKASNGVCPAWHPVFVKWTGQDTD